MVKLIKSTFLNEAETKKKLCDFIMRANVLSLDAECKKFEERFAKKQGRAYAVFVNSGSSANLLLIQALLNLGYLERGDRVGVSAITWSTNIMPLIQLGLIPVSIDGELDSLNISPRTLSERIEGLRAVFLTNVLGFSDDIKAIAELCEEKGVTLLEDNCESLGSRSGGKLLGNFGLASTFSFFCGHHISTVEGGMIATDDAELYHALLIARAHGWDRNMPKAMQEEIRAREDVDPFFALYTFYDLGFNVRPTEITGFIGNIQLDYWDDLVQKREANFNAFHELVLRNDECIPLEVGHMDTVSNFAMPLLLKTKELFHKYKKRFEEAGVEIRPVIAGNVTKHPFYRKYGVVSASHPNADFIHENAFYFPNNPELTEEEVALLRGLLVA